MATDLRISIKPYYILLTDSMWPVSLCAVPRCTLRAGIGARAAAMKHFKQAVSSLFASSIFYIYEQSLPLASILPRILHTTFYYMTSRHQK